MENSNENFTPKIIAFLCNWCSYEAADNAGTKRLSYAPEVVPVRVMCSGMIDPQYLFYSLKQGADGVFIGGCHYGDCHYKNGNFKAYRRIELMKKLMDQLGIDQERIKFENISAAEADKFADSISQFVKKVSEMGPSPIKTGGCVNE